MTIKVCLEGINTSDAKIKNRVISKVKKRAHDINVIVLFFIIKKGRGLY